MLKFIFQIIFYQKPNSFYASPSKLYTFPNLKKGCKLETIDQNALLKEFKITVNDQINFQTVQSLINILPNEVSIKEDTPNSPDELLKRIKKIYASLSADPNFSPLNFFCQMDLDLNGVISFKEFEEACNPGGVFSNESEPADVDMLFSAFLKIDLDEDWELRYYLDS